MVAPLPEKKPGMFSEEEKKLDAALNARFGKHRTMILYMAVFISIAAAVCMSIGIVEVYSKPPPDCLVLMQNFTMGMANYQASHLSNYNMTLPVVR
jgi:hypothetical protein